VHRRRNAFCEHGLASAGRSDHEHTSLALAAGAHVVPPLLHQRQNPAHLGNRGLLAADIFDLHLVVRFSGIHIRTPDAAVYEERAEEQHEVRNHDHKEVGELRQGGCEHARQCTHRIQRTQAVEHEKDCEVDAEEDRQPRHSAPEESAVRLDGSLVLTVFRSDPFAEDKPALEKSQDSAADQHRNDCVDERPTDAQLKSDQPKGKS